ncbi:hypothetical protein [Microbacterium stercoris]|uniref:Uncharacterized protein n=1 Tax=Microbacterium stercoris TaxID=2820289 RepID=A0A939TN13_9MICO|nr:hypothetical protein [Microbacterium stercoris]MBO3663748.1 hypothetical protein [Microbacterium stercoris]
MSVERIREHAEEGLSGGAVCAGLMYKYLGLAAYGAWAMIVEIPTFTIVAGASFAFAWAAAVTALALLAAAAVARTWTTGRYRFEQLATWLLIMVFLGYSGALLGRGGGAAPLAAIPAILVGFPAIRVFSLARRRKGSQDAAG